MNKSPMTKDRNDLVIIELDKPRTLRLGHKALKRFSAMNECSMVELEQAIQRYDKLTSLVYIMLSEEDPSLTPEQVDNLLDQKSLKEITEACNAAIEAAFVDENAEEAPEDPPQAAGTGTKA